jgi:succinyl-diaminopimelate desuccinylase
MKDQKEMLLHWIEDDRDKLVDFLSHFIQAKSPNPPGDTRAAAAHIRQFLDEKALPYRIIAPQEEMPNIVGSFECGASGRHLVLNGHTDVFPVGDTVGWTYDPWGGTVADGRVYGRGAADMKCGTTASIFTFAYLHRIRDRLKGRLTLTCVSDEENFGPWGTRYLMEHHPEIHGDCCLNGEPSNPYIIHFGERGLIWLAFTVHTRGGYGPHTHMAQNAIKIATQLIADLEVLSEIQVLIPADIDAVLRRNAEVINQVQGKETSEIVRKVTVNIGTIRGGLKVNMVPSECVVEADIRLPMGLDKGRMMAEVEKIALRYPEVSCKEINYAPPNWCEPYGVMVKFIRANVKALRSFEPEPFISLGGTDAKRWRYLNVPAYLYGPFPRNICAANEYVEIEEFLHIVKTHVLSAYDYLTLSDSKIGPYNTGNEI